MKKVLLQKFIGLLSDNDVNIKNIGIIHNRETFDGALDLEFYSLEDQEKAYEVLKNQEYRVNKIK